MMPVRIVLLGAAACLTLVACSPKSEKPAPAPAAAAVKPDAQKLVGKWLRPDGGYVIEVKSASAEGKLDAAYLNPNPINVSRAEWRVSDEGLLIVVVELRDANYPGALYTLRFDPASDTLVGTYYQPVAGQTYEIGFERVKP